MDKDGIDPSIFIDDDGNAYFFWGQIQMRGGQLKDDLFTLMPERLKRSIIDEQEFGFHEGASMRKQGGIYYLIYSDISRGKPTCLSYAYSIKPLGPFQKGGVIIDNIGCDPSTWNNHGSLQEFNGQWYVFYHSSSMNSKFNRRARVEKIAFSEDGMIQEVEMTTQGAEGSICA